MARNKKRKGEHSPQTRGEKREKILEKELEENETEMNVETENQPQVLANPITDEQKLEEALSQLMDITEELKMKKLTHKTQDKIKTALSHLSEISSGNKDKNITKENLKPKRTEKKNITEEMILPGMKDDACYIKIQFENELKRTINAFQIYDELKKIAVTELSTICTLNQNSFVTKVKIESVDTLEKLENLKSIAGKDCIISMYDPFNCKKGIMYLTGMDFDDETIGEFKQWIMEKYNYIIDIQLATFIRTRNPDSRAFIVTMALKSLPHSIYIPGLTGDTRVYPFRNRPMSCKKCLKYGHTEKKCRHSGPPLCGKCSATGHTRESCESEEPRCYHCGDDHAVGSKLCPRHIRECELVRIQEEHKVSFKRAIQIQNGNEIITLNNDRLPDAFTIQMTAENKKTLKPWVVERFMKDYLNGNFEDFRSISSTTYFLKTKDYDQSEKVLSLETINQVPVEVKRGNLSSRPRGIVYINEYDVSNFEHYKSELIKLLPVSDILRASWIKSFNNRATPLLLIFNTPEVPNFVSIPGETALNKVYEYKNKPLFCTRCVNYGHTTKRCEGPVVCGKCGERGHSVDICSSDTTKCLHCSGPHHSGSKECEVYRREMEIVTVQKKQGLSRNQAKYFIERNNPLGQHLNFSAAVKKPTNLHNSQSNEIQTRTHPTIQSSEQNNLPVNRKTKTKSYIPQNIKTNVLLQSPNSGRIYEDQIDLEPSTSANHHSDSLLEDDETTTRQMFNEISKTKITKTNRLSDREQYEQELRKSTINRHSSKENRHQNNRRRTSSENNKHRSRSNHDRRYSQR